MKPSEFASYLPPSVEEKISLLSQNGILFLTEPNSSKWAWRWSFFMCTCTLMNVIFLILISMDGPNNYEGKPNMATYPALFDAQQYILGGKIVWTPMCFDVAMRILCVCGIFLTNEDNASDFSEDTFKVVLFFMDMLSVIPFISLSLYYYPRNSKPATFFRLLFRVLELFSCAKILRGTKDLPAVLAIRITLSRAIPHLILPIFFFLVFNIFFGVVVYFMEPCYNYSICAWADLFEASFYSVVSMTTTGYGNQIPNFLPARFIGVIIMLFGSVFMSMPLAIIGNEYGEAWSSLKAEKTIETVETATETLQKTLPLQVEVDSKTNTTHSNNTNSFASTQEMLRRASSTEVKKEAYTLAQQALLSPLIECRKNLDLSVSNLGKLLAPAKKMNPAILLAMCELRGWIAPLLWNIRVAVEAVDKDAKKQSIDSRKLSVFRINTNDQSSSSQSSTTNSSMLNASNAPLAGLMRPNIKASQASNLGALRENPEEDEDKDAEEKETISPTLSHHNINAVAPLPPIKKNRAPTAYPNASNTKAHLSAVKKFISNGISNPSRRLESDNSNRDSNSNNNSGVPMRPSFWPLMFWGSSSPNMDINKTTPLDNNNNNNNNNGQLHGEIQLNNSPTKINKRVSPLPQIQQNNNNNNNSDNNSSEDEKSGEQIAPAEMVSINTRQTIPKSNAQELAKQIKINQINAAVGSLQKQPSFVQKMITKQKSMESMTFIIKLAKAAPDIAKMRGDGTEFTKNMERAVQSPKALRTKLWMLMELPSSSRPARFIQIYLIILIMLSVLVLYTETLPSFANYSESSPLCGQVLNIYCSDKHNITLDPGCFVQDYNGPTTEKLKYDCSDSDCFGHGLNYGARWTNMTCDPNYPRPFQTLEQLIYNFRAADFTIPREKMHKIQDVCYRVECRYDSPHTVDGNIGWIPLEILINLSFSIEIILRILVSYSWSSFFLDVMNIFDILSVIPFYIDIIGAFKRDKYQLDFSVIASSPAPIILVALKSLKVFRLFKMTRHFSATQVLFRTANNAWKQILGMLSLLVFIVTIFALLLYEVEKGHPCYVGDSNCEVPEEVRATLHIGQQIWISKEGELTKFASVLDSLWFSVVTLTSTGYGDMVPVTNLGQTFSIFLMLFGAFYMTMPLTVVATTFWESHQAYLEKQKKKKRDANKKLLDEIFLRKLNTLENVLVLATKKLDSFFTDIQQPNSTNTPQVPFLDRCFEIQSLLINLMKVHDSDIKRLSVVYTSHIANNDDENSHEVPPSK